MKEPSSVGFIGEEYLIVDKILKVDKLALGLLTTLVALMLGQLWYVGSNMTRMEVVHAQLEASQRTVLDSIKQMSEIGSGPDNRLEAAIGIVGKRIEGLEKAMDAMIMLHEANSKAVPSKKPIEVLQDWGKRSIDRHKLTD